MTHKLGIILQNRVALYCEEIQLFQYRLPIEIAIIFSKEDLQFASPISASHTMSNLFIETRFEKYFEKNFPTHTTAVFVLYLCIDH